MVRIIFKCFAFSVFAGGLLSLALALVLSVFFGMEVFLELRYLAASIAFMCAGIGMEIFKTKD